MLHTWGQQLEHHPHVHAVVPGGGLTPDGQSWRACRPNFLLPVKVLGRSGGADGSLAWRQACPRTEYPDTMPQVKVPRHVVEGDRFRSTARYPAALPSRGTWFLDTTRGGMAGLRSGADSAVFAPHTGQRS